MPRIPDHLLDRIKREIPVRQLVERAGIELRGLGENLAGRCNRHEDSTASLIVTPDKNLFHCMGACQKGGSVIDWVMWQKEKEIGFHQAARELAEEFFPDDAQKLFGRKTEIAERRRGEELPSPLREGAEDQELVSDAVAYYQARLERSPEALSYLGKRGLDDAELIARFRLGYGDRTLGVTLSAKLRRKLQELGFFRSSGHEHFNGSLTVPFFGEKGEVLGCYGRKINDNLRPGTPDHLYLPGPHRGLLNREAFKASGEIILCEAPLDALSAWRHGFRNVTTAFGVEGFSEELHEAFLAHRTERVLIAFDRDAAGEKGAEKIAKKLAAAGIACYRVLFPKGMDLNDVALKMHPAEKTLGLFLRSAEWMCGGNGAKAVLLGAHGTNGSNGNGAHVVKAALEPESPLVLKTRRAEAAATNPGEAAKKEKPAQAAKEGSISSGPLVSLGDDEAVFLFGDRRYRVRGLKRNTAFGVLKLNILLTREDAAGGDLFAGSPLTGLHADTFDLYLARARQLFERQAALELGVKDDVVKRDLAAMLRKLEDAQAEALRKLHEPKVSEILLSEKETEEALAFWKSPNLLDRIVSDMTACGHVGEATNKLVTYIGAVSRLLDRPLAVIIQSSSAAGKTSLMEAVLALMPEESREKYSAVSGKSLFYFGDDASLSHKILAIVEEEGAEKATYPLKLLQSEGELVMASTGKDPQTGKLVTQVYRVKGPVMIILTTTAIELDPELENRCLRLAVDESREQTKRIHELQRQRQTLEGLHAGKLKERIQRTHRNAQRLLRPVKVLNPYVNELTFVNDQTRTRRDHDKYLTLIEAIALMHQHQRPLRRVEIEGEIVECIEVALSDIEIANRLAGEVLGRTLDELPPQTRRFLAALDAMVSGLCEEHGVERCDLRFTGKDARERTGFSYDQVRVHMGRLIALEYVLVHRGGRGQSFVFELLYRGEGIDGRPFVLGLVPVEELRGGEARRSARGTTATLGGEEAGFGVPLGAQWGVNGGPVGTPENGPRPAPRAAFSEPVAKERENALLPPAGESPSYIARPRTPRLNLLRFPPERPAEARARAPRLDLLAAAGR